MLTKEKYDWDSVPLGTMSDSNISKKYKIPIATVSNARKRRGIEKVKRDPLDRERFNWGDIPLGAKSDADICREYGLKASSVGTARARRGIPAFTEDGSISPHRGMRGIDWDDEKRLGKMRDTELQKLLGLRSVSSVSRARAYRGIAKYAPPTYKVLAAMHKDLEAKWNNLDAVEARHGELSARTKEGAR